MTNIKFTLLIIFSILFGIFLGVFFCIAWMSFVSEGLDGEYFRAIRTIVGSDINWIDAIFRYCVIMLVKIAKIIGISYEELNIWVFIVIQPLIIFLLLMWVLILRKKLKNFNYINKNFIQN